MPLDVTPRSTSLYFPTIILSDLHLGKYKVVEAPLLLEFLENIQCDTLYLNGDIIDGWYLEKHKHRPFPESHIRVLDAINRLAAQGTKIVYLPGNHDERLRYSSRADMDKNRLKQIKPAFSKQVVFQDKRAGISCPFLFASDMVVKDKTGRNMQILHGDVFDPPWVGGRWSKVGDKAYDAMVIANTTFSELYKQFNGGTRFSFAKLLKKKTKDAIGIIKNFEKAATDLPTHIDGMVCGHIHHAEVTDKKGTDKKSKLYVNSGDWIESCSAAVQDSMGTWKILHWESLRKELGFKGDAKMQETNPNAAYRNVSLQQLRVAQYLWPAKNRHNLIKKAAAGKIDPHTLALG